MTEQKKDPFTDPEKFTGVALYRTVEQLRALTLTFETVKLLADTVTRMQDELDSVYHQLQAVLLNLKDEVYEGEYTITVREDDSIEEGKLTIVENNGTYFLREWTRNGPADTTFNALNKGIKDSLYAFVAESPVDIVGQLDIDIHVSHQMTTISREVYDEHLKAFPTLKEAIEFHREKVTEGEEKNTVGDLEETPPDDEPGEA